eukprot:Colp12_sorted_trinity150504_noHs@31847
MGAGASAVEAETIETLESKTIFSAAEIKQLNKRFLKLSSEAGSKGKVPSDRLLTLPELAFNPLLHRLLHLFDPQKTGYVDFQAFVMTLSVLNPKSDNQGRIKVAFSVYDVDGDGFISADDLFKIFKLFSRGALHDEQVDYMVTMLMSHPKLKKPGLIGPDDFLEVC